MGRCGQTRQKTDTNKDTRVIIRMEVHADGTNNKSQTKPTNERGPVSEDRSRRVRIQAEARPHGSMADVGRQKQSRGKQGGGTFEYKSNITRYRYRQTQKHRHDWIKIRRGCEDGCPIGGLVALTASNVLTSVMPSGTRESCT